MLAMLALWMIGVTQFNTSVALFGLQSVAVGCLTVWIGHSHHEPMLIIIGMAVVVLKGLGAPLYLLYAAKRVGCRRETNLSIAPPIQLCLAGSALAFFALSHPFRGELPLTALPSLDIIFLGMLFMVTRRLAVSQIIGFLVLENGIFLFTITLPHPMPTLIDIGVLMDILAGTMLAGLLAFRINSAFEHIDVSRLKELHG
jgi:hydrogenase-4 component E